MLKNIAKANIKGGKNHDDFTTDPSEALLIQ